MSRFLLFEKSSKSGVLKENIFHEDEVIAEEISDQTTTPNKKDKNEKAKKTNTRHITKQKFTRVYLKRENTTQRGNVVINNNNNIKSIIIILGSKWIRNKQESVIFVPSMPPRFSKKNDYYY